MDPRTAAYAYRYLRKVLPLAVRELSGVRARAQGIPNLELQRQALASIRTKDFHAFGACIFATFLPLDHIAPFVRLAVTFETAVDYLDNLVDRLGTSDADDMSALHEALADAVTPGAKPRRYFRHRDGDDGGYLASLVADSQHAFARLPAFDVIRRWVAASTQRYCDLQVRKHLAPGDRERACADAFSTVAADLRWWEGAAACGSTMPVFALAFSALDPSCDAAGAQATHDAYFPYLAALHILLDYFVDRAEDRRHGELNFIDCYPTGTDARASIERLEAAALQRVSGLKQAEPHAFALRAMCAYYSTRSGARANGGASMARAVLAGAGLLDAGGRRSSVLNRLLADYAQTVRT